MGRSNVRTDRDYIHIGKCRFDYSAFETGVDSFVGCFIIKEFPVGVKV